ncbi:basic membrane protein [bacterium BMS3Bbin01]|nr:basic membrane protein [bacterium BMS3Bbin01]
MGKRTNIRWRSWLLMVAVLALVGTACATGTSTTTAAPAASTTTAAPAATTTAAPAATTTAAPGETTAVVDKAVTKVAIATPEEPVDFGWNQQGVEGAQAAAAAAGVEIEVAGGLGYDAPTQTLRQLAETANLIYAHASGFGDSAKEVAVETGVPVIVYSSPDAREPGVAAFVGTSAEEGGYLAGILAAETTKTGTLGIVISADDFNWNRHSGGFVAGACSVNPSIKILLVQIGEAAYGDVEGGTRVTESVIAGGADVILGNGDGSSFGMMRAVETADPPPGADKVWFIDVIGDKTSLDKDNVLLSSILWDFEPTYLQAIKDVDAGIFGDKNYVLNLATGGIGLLRTQNISDALWTEIETAKAGIIDGTIKVPAVETRAEVETLIGCGA